ncbi:unnamed protein product [Bathycoccus prasinos]
MFATISTASGGETTSVSSVLSEANISHVGHELPERGTQDVPGPSVMSGSSAFAKFSRNAAAFLNMSVNLQWQTNASEEYPEMAL